MRDSSGDGVTTVARLATDGATARGVADSLAERFDSGDAAVAAFEASTGGWTVEIYFERTPDQEAVRALVGDLAGDTAREALVFETIAARDWVAASLEGLQPVESGRFFLHGAHHRSRVPPNRIGIEIEAALAFGTGHHGTTRGCLLALDRLLKCRRPGQVLDVGAGTGVLAIAAARARRRPVLASDIDAMSVRLARQNARINCAAALVEIIEARGLVHRRFRERAPFGLVFANILLGPLRLLANPIGRLVAPSGCVVLSGLLPGQANAAFAAYRAHGFMLERRILLDGWCTLILRRPSRRIVARRPYS